MRVSALKYFFLLTALFGYLQVVVGQVNPTDSLEQNGSKPDSVSNTPFVLSTDSIYGTSLDNTTPEDEGFLESLVEYTADDSIFGSPAEGLIFLYNKAVVTYQDIKLEAGFIRIDMEKKQLYAEGLPDSNGVMQQKPIFHEGGKSYRADAMRYNFESKKAFIKKVITKEGEGFLHGEKIKKVSDDVFYVRNASFTTCSHEHPHFRINTPKAKVISGEKVVTQFAYLEILDVPTPLMVPFGFFPTTEKRKSGIIIPTYGSSDYRGYFLRSGGYYWAASEYVDLTLTGDIYTQGGYGLQAQSNYRKRYKYNGSLSVAYNLLRYGEPEFQEFLPQAYQNSSDFRVNWNHNQDPKARPDFKFNSRVNIASQNYYAITGTNPADVLTNQLASSVSFQKLFPGKPLNLTVSLNHSQNNRTKDVTYGLPRVNFGVNRVFPFKRTSRVGGKAWYEEIYFSYSLDGKNDIRTKIDQPLFTRDVWRDSTSAGIQHNLPISASYKVFKYFNFQPSITYTERWLFKQVSYGYVDSLNRAVAIDTVNGFFANRNFNTSAGLNTNLYGQWNYNKGFLKALRHVATPNVSFTYAPDFSTDFWGYYQEVQSDSLGNTQRLNRYQYSPYGSAPAGEQGTVGFSILNTLEAKVRDNKDTTGTGTKKIKILERLSLSTGHNLAADAFNWSPLQLAATSSLFNRLISLNYNATFDFYGYDATLKQRVNRAAVDVNGTLLRNTNQSFAVSFNLNADSFKSKPKEKNEKGKSNSFEGSEKKEVSSEEAKALGLTPGDINYYTRRGFVDFNVPWNLSVQYNLRASKPALEPTIQQAITLDGSITLTENWAVSFSTGYDLEANDFNYTSLNFVRDLHCWQMTCSWIPFGFQQQYALTIRVNSQVLSDLKLERRRGIGDFNR